MIRFSVASIFALAADVHYNIGDICAVISRRIA